MPIVSSFQPARRRDIRRMAISIGLSTAPFGFAFGVACSETGLRWWEALAFSSLVFGGSAQFAAVGVLGQCGSAFAAVVAGSLLNLRSLAFGLLLAPALTGPLWFRVVASQLMIDESTAVAMTSDDVTDRRYGYLAAGLSVFVFWNLSTLVGVLTSGSSGTLVADFGLDATIPAAFLALLWPRLSNAAQRRAVLAGLIVAGGLVPFTPPGIPIIASGRGALASVRRATK